MQAVAQSSSEEVLRLVDRLLTEGHSPTHFARQMVRFLRNAVVAKVAGGDSSLLQISGDERQRVTRVAQLFSEEDLARHLQIMLRTHSELGYRQEQRFHLELGLLKMAHAQRLLPIEQLLSDAGLPSSSARPAGKPSVVPDKRKVEPPTRSSHVSPFAADSARKTGSKPEMTAEVRRDTGPRIAAVGSTQASVVVGSAAPASVTQPATEVFIQPEPETAPAASPTGQDDLHGAVLKALTGAGHRMLAAMLEAGVWQVEGNQLVIKVASSEAVIDMSLGKDAKRLVIATASGVLGRPVQFKVVPAGEGQKPAKRVQSNGGGRNRAEEEPVVRRMKEKFGAEIRTIIDHRDRR
jgi:DNA polymerase-3 subunit gamma/tau